ncbi:hypothetical protein QUA92_29890 [Microcoleus sp. F8-C1]
MDMATNNNSQKMTVDRVRAIAQQICEQQGTREIIQIGFASR